MASTTPPRGPIRVLTTGGMITLSGLGDAEATEVGRHWNAVRRYLETGEDTALAEFQRSFIRGRELAASAALVEWFAVRGEVSFESIYDEVI